jgi:hypothetical protein
MSCAADLRIGYALRRHGERGGGSGGGAWIARGARVEGRRWADRCREGDATRTDSDAEIMRQGTEFGDPACVTDSSESGTKFAGTVQNFAGSNFRQFW